MKADFWLILAANYNCPFTWKTLVIKKKKTPLQHIYTLLTGQTDPET